MHVEALSYPGQATATEKPLPKLEFSGKHLEAAYIHRATYHKQRILQAFGKDQELPPLPQGELSTLIAESEKRYKKSADLLYREDPLEMPPLEGEITKDLVVAVADNLAWKAIECDITSACLADIDKGLKAVTKHSNGSDLTKMVDQMKAHNRGFKAVVIEDNHFFRDFFDREMAEKLGLDSPKTMQKFLQRASISGKSREFAKGTARGISLEIAAKRYLSGLLGEKASVSFGNSSQDKSGGDIVVTVDGKVLYIDLKSMRPGNGNGYGEDEIERGFRLTADNRKHIFKAVVWPETSEAVAEDSFRITDPALKASLQKLLAEIH